MAGVIRHAVAAFVVDSFLMAFAVTSSWRIFKPRGRRAFCLGVIASRAVTCRLRLCRVIGEIRRRGCGCLHTLLTKHGSRMEAVAKMNRVSRLIEL